MSDGRWRTYCWRRRWRKVEIGLFHMGGMYGSVNWMVCKTALDRIGGVWS